MELSNNHNENENLKIRIILYLIFRNDKNEKIKLPTADSMNSFLVEFSDCISTLAIYLECNRTRVIS